MKSKTAKKKFDHLLKNRPPDNRWVVNLSNKVLNPNEEAVLRKGMNFSDTPGWIPVDDIIAGVEGGLQGLTGSDRQEWSVLKSCKPPSHGPFRRPCMIRRRTSCFYLQTWLADHDKVISLLADQKVLDRDQTPGTKKDECCSVGVKNGTISEALYKLRSLGGHISCYMGYQRCKSLGSPSDSLSSFPNT